MTIVSRHIRELESAGIVGTVNTSSTRGLQKLCFVKPRGTLLEFSPQADNHCWKTIDIPIGNYVDWSVSRPCGLATVDHVIGEVDDPRYFADPSHTQANMIWLSSGYLEYAVPNYMNARQSIRSLRFQMEICSEAPGYCEDWPSDIRFFLNGRDLGYWTCPGDFGEKRGLHTPEWMGRSTQYGLLKTLLVNDRGAFIDGTRISDTTIDSVGLTYQKPFYFRIASLPDEQNPRGFNLFGAGFGNYESDLKVLIEYDELQAEA